MDFKKIKNKLLYFLELTKPKLTLLVLITFFFGGLLTSIQIVWWHWGFLLISMGMLVGGSCAINCYLEQGTDLLMVRTKSRVIPSGKITAKQGLIFGLILVCFGLVFLYLSSNFLTVFLGFLSCLIYVFLYTGMKKSSSWALFIGAIPGALPPVMGRIALVNSFDFEAVILFLVLFFWQLAHFLSIAVYHSEDYLTAKIKTVYSTMGLSFTKWSIFFYSLALTITTMLPVHFLRKPKELIIFSGILGLFLLGQSVRGFFIEEKESSLAIKKWAKLFFWFSIWYLPILFGGMLILW
jgi:protoheme IX farnesyltransferase